MINKVCSKVQVPSRGCEVFASGQVELKKRSNNQKMNNDFQF